MIFVHRINKVRPKGPTSNMVMGHVLRLEGVCFVNTHLRGNGIMVFMLHQSTFIKKDDSRSGRFGAKHLAAANIKQ